MYLVCPLCGKLAHLSRFNPDEYDDDIKCVEMRSLGRAKGFEVTRRFSALGDKELMDLISSRCHAILTIIGEEVTEKSAATALVNRLRDEIAELEKSVEENKDEVEAWRAESEELVTRINDAFNAEYEELDDAVAFLLEVALEE